MSTAIRTHVGHRNAVMAIVFVVLAGWSGLSYLVIRVDSDILAEAIQVQRWLAEPFFVLSYPGQLYGGVLEYPLIAVAEALFPGQVYAFTAIRILYLPIVGALAVYAASLLFPTWRLWPFIPAVVVGPAVLHSMMAIKDLYPFSWLLVMIGVVVTYSQWRRNAPSLWLILGGALMGLGVYQHPTASLLAVPLAAAGIIRWGPVGKQLWLWLMGFLIGLMPLVAARFGQGDRYVAYLPERTGLPNVWGAFGLDGTTWATALVPNGWGLQYTDLNTLTLPTWLQIAANWLVFLFVAGCIVVLVQRLVTRRLFTDSSDGVVVAAMWGSFAVVLVAIVVVVPPVFFYGAALAVPVWITLTAGLNGLAGAVGRFVAIVVMVLAAITSLGAVLAWNPALPGAVGFKNKQAEQVAGVAARIEAAGINVVFGDYWETLPVVYASAGNLTGVTVPVSRFPFPESLQGSVVVAVPTGYTALPPGLDRWTNAEASVGFMDANCTRLPQDVVVDPFPIRTYECPVAAFG